jgi:hypothetical protein
MYCSKCGAEISASQDFCSRCGHSTNAAKGTQVAEGAELSRFQGKIRRLRRFWYLFAALSAVLGIIGLFAVQTGLTMHTGPWEPWPHPYIWNWTVAGGVAWTLLLLRIAAAIAAGWGLERMADWSRPVALIAACIAFLDFPIGFVLAVYTFSVLLGKHHAQLYELLRHKEMTLVAR